MEKQLEKAGKTIDAAIQAALDELGMDRDQVSVEVLEKPKSGFLGLGSTPARVRVSYSVSRADRVEAFLTGLLARMDSEARPVVTTREDGTLNVEFVGNGLGMLIGHRGDTLDAIQHLTNFAVNRGEEESVRVDVDAENYRAKRVEALKRLAQKTGEKVLKTHRSMTLESMNAYERHIIHAALQEMPGLSTHSVGVEPNRRVVVASTRAPESRPPAGGGDRRVGSEIRRPRPSGLGPRPSGLGGDRPSGDRAFGGDRGFGDRSRPRPSGGSPYSGPAREGGGPRPPRGGGPGGGPGGRPSYPRADRERPPETARPANLPVQGSRLPTGPGARPSAPKAAHEENGPGPRPYERIRGEE